MRHILFASAVELTFADKFKACFIIKASYFGQISIKMQRENGLARYMAPKDLGPQNPTGKLAHWVDLLSRMLSLKLVSEILRPESPHTFKIGNPYAVKNLHLRCQVQDILYYHYYMMIYAFILFCLYLSLLTFILNCLSTELIKLKPICRRTS